MLGTVVFARPTYSSGKPGLTVCTVLSVAGGNQAEAVQSPRSGPDLHSPICALALIGDRASPVTSSSSPFPGDKAPISSPLLKKKYFPVKTQQCYWTMTTALH